VSGLVRSRGRADYAGWKLYVRGTRARVYVGHPLLDCLIFWALWRVGRLRDSEITGPIIELRLVRPGSR
jgi:hypothetical protein